MDIKYHLHRTLPGHIYHRWKERRFEKHTLPKTAVTELEGVRLDVENLDINIKRNILIKAYEAPEIAVCKKIIEPGEKILEIGGAIGFVGLFCLISLKAETVVSVEPNPMTLKRFRKNYQLNGFTPNIIEAAIADEDKNIQLKTSSEFWTDSILTFSNNSMADLIEVKAMTLASILRATKEQFSTLIIDVEGAETLIKWDQLPSSVGKLVLELHPDMVGHPTAYHVLNEILDRGFQVVDRNANVFGLVKRAG